MAPISFVPHTACDWLNGFWASDPPSPAPEASRRRIEEFVRLLQESLAAVSKETKPFTREPGPKEGWNVWLPHALPKKTSQLVDTLNQTLFNYKSRYMLSQDVDGSWKIKDGLVIEADSPESEADAGAEGFAAFELVETAKRGLIARIRQCECGKWYFAVREKQRSCSAKCRHKRYEKSLSFKTHRSRYMKDFYRNRTHKMIQWAAKAALNWRCSKGDQREWIASQVNKKVIELHAKEDCKSWRTITTAWVTRHSKEIAALCRKMDRNFNLARIDRQ